MATLISSLRDMHDSLECIVENYIKDIDVEKFYEDAGLSKEDMPYALDLHFGINYFELLSVIYNQQTVFERLFILSIIEGV